MFKNVQKSPKNGRELMKKGGENFFSEKEKRANTFLDAKKGAFFVEKGGGREGGAESFFHRGKILKKPARVTHKY